MRIMRPCLRNRRWRASLNLRSEQSPACLGLNYPKLLKKKHLHNLVCGNKSHCEASITHTKNKKKKIEKPKRKERETNSITFSFLEIFSQSKLLFSLFSLSKKKKTKQSAIMLCLFCQNLIALNFDSNVCILLCSKQRIEIDENPAKSVGFRRKIVRRRRSRRRLFLQKFWSQEWNYNGELQWLVICWWRRCRFGVSCWFHLRLYF